MLKKFSISKEEWISLLKGAGIAAGGAVITYLLQKISSMDFGTATAAVVAVSSVVLNYLRKVLNNTEDNV